jgi:hypothetical protein
VIGAYLGLLLLGWVVAVALDRAERWVTGDRRWWW